MRCQRLRTLQPQGVANGIDRVDNTVIILDTFITLTADFINDANALNH